MYEKRFTCTRQEHANCQDVFKRIAVNQCSGLENCVRYLTLKCTHKKAFGRWNRWCHTWYRNSWRVL